MKTLILSVAMGALGMCAWGAESPQIPAGTEIAIRLGQTISSASAKSGETFAATLAHDLVVGGKRFGRKGDPVQGRVSEAKASGRLSAPGVLKLTLVSVNGHPVDPGLVSREGGSHKGRNMKSAAGGGALGAIIGGLAGGGKGAAIGAGAGAAAGTAGAAATGKKDVEYKAETVLRFLTQ